MFRIEQFKMDFYFDLRLSYKKLTEMCIGMHKYILICFLLFQSSSAFATEGVIKNALVTDIGIYESTDDSLFVWIYLNGSSRPVNNPSNELYTCELWVLNKTIYLTALSALLSSKKVTISYRDRGEGTYWCIVHSLFIHAN